MGGVGVLESLVWLDGGIMLEGHLTRLAYMILTTRYLLGFAACPVEASTVLVHIHYSACSYIYLSASATSALGRHNVEHV